MCWRSRHQTHTQVCNQQRRSGMWCDGIVWRIVERRLLDACVASCTNRVTQIRKKFDEQLKWIITTTLVRFWYLERAFFASFSVSSRLLLVYALTGSEWMVWIDMADGRWTVLITVYVHHAGTMPSAYWEFGKFRMWKKCFSEWKMHMTFGPIVIAWFIQSKIISKAIFVRKLMLDAFDSTMPLLF